MKYFPLVNLAAKNTSFFLFLSVLSAEFDYFGNILKQAVPRKSCLSRQSKKGYVVKQDMQKNKIKNVFFKTVGLEVFSTYYFWIWGLQHLCSINAGIVWVFFI